MTAHSNLAEASAFIAVLDQKSFTKAARLLGLSPPRVSELVRNFEERLGVRLVERSTRSVSASAAGEHLLNRLRPVIQEYQEALDSTNEFRSRPSGALRLTLSPPAADFVLLPVVSRFASLYPEITLDISVDPAPVDIVAERFDAGIRQGNQLERDMIAVRVGAGVAAVTVASPAYLAHHGAPKTPHDLMTHSGIRFRMQNEALYPWRFRINGRITDAHAVTHLVTNDRTTALKAAIDGLGIVQAPLPYVASELADGRLVKVLEDYEPPLTDPFFLYYPSRRHVRPALMALRQFLYAAVRDDGSKAEVSPPGPPTA